MVYRIYVGSYTNEIFALSFDPSTSSLQLVSTLTVGFHPSWVTSHPSDPSVIYAGIEKDDGLIVAVKYDQDGKGTVIQTISSGGSSPCTLVVHDNTLLAGNYMCSSVLVVPLSKESPHLIPEDATRLSFSGTGPNEDRQEKSHPHQVIIHPNREELLVPDLGADKTWRLLKGSNGEWEVKGYIQYNAGSGPRHVAFHNDNIYTILELTSEISVHRVPPLPAEPTLLDTIPTMSKFPGSPASLGMLAAEILIPPANKTFPTPYLYASNRNDPSSEGDVISIYSITNPNKLELAAEVRSGLKHLRGMLFGGPDDRYLVAGGAHGPGVKLFERTDGGRGLKEIAFLDLQGPTSFLWA